MNARTMLVLVAALGLSGCSTTMLIVSGNDAPPPVAREERPARGPQSLGIPPGQLPPPGMCRVWFPGRPPGHQPRPGRCESLASQVPPGAWLISRDRGSDRVRVSVYDQNRPGVRAAVRIYSASDGRLLAGDD